MRSLSFEHHNHAHCVEDTIRNVAQHCAAHKLQFTAMRQRVLEIMLQEHRAWGAYEILDRLREEGHSAQPPVAYRALDFLVSNGFAHKIERLNAFIACFDPAQDHVPFFMICRKCHSVAETHADEDRAFLNKIALNMGFEIERTVVEAEGVCPQCRT
ncbi:transcriptional repressor [Epibacterium sp. SM1969]|uniref:Transcriptional repressor n=1 Tax=Tritonibacter aquimaris TaxID=2663379 RepID=A0A844AVJ2_9RHOB|nr:Fur family transcriptional regulator [Tritonibacter aquimaris]MQY43887.1 transcriptional repressor [Tritonibacter aquimaris]